VVGRANHIDIRNFGSGNAGTTNAIRTLGWKAGSLTFLGDALKAILAILLVRYLIYSNEIVEYLPLYAGFGVVIGHNFPFWLHFKGGKGIAATGGVMISFDWRLGLSALAVFLIVTITTRYVSLASLIISMVFPIWMLIMYPDDIHMFLVSILFTLFAFIKHRTNIKRLMNGTENKIGHKIKIESHQ